MSLPRRIINVITLVSCLGFVFLGLYLYFIKGVSSQPMLILGILFFGMGAVVMIISLTSEHEKWSIDVKKLSRKQAIIMGICGIIFSFCAFWLALFGNILLLLRVILFLGFLSIGRWSVLLLFRNIRKQAK